MTHAELPLPAVSYEPSLVEEAVARALAGRRLEPRYRAARERCYGELDPEDRDRAFREVDLRFLAELGLDRPVERELEARPVLRESLSRVAVVRAPSLRDEGADLFARANSGPPTGRGLALGLALLPETLARPEAMKALLDRELLHVGDLLDPAFGFDPALPETALPPLLRAAARERYRGLWRTSVEGRLARAGQGGSGAREKTRADLARALPRTADVEAIHQALFDGPRPPHAELLALAEHPPSSRVDADERGGPCPLCGFPTHDFEPSPEDLPDAVRDAIGSESPAWSPASGLCRQCADLYRARFVERSARGPREERSERP